MSWELLTTKDDLTRAEARPVRPPALRDGEVRLAVEQFALTMNSVTYARLGDSEMPFWNAFPAQAGYGRVPVWGFVRVEESRNPDVAVGERFFGFVPIATHHVVPASPTDRGFLDLAPHRGFLPTWYRTFQRVGEPDELDDRRAVFRPIFPASFNLADFLLRQESQGAKSVLVSSASSKAAIGLADLLSRGSDLRITGLTSARNVEFVRGLGCYDVVAGYHELHSVSLLAPAVFVDFTGAHHRIAEVYEQFPGELGHTALVGYTHPESVQQPPELTEPEPEIFFTPVVEEQVAAVEVGFYDRYHEAENRFLAATTDWLTVRSRTGPDAIADGFRALLTGGQPPSVTYVFRPQ